MSAWDPLLHVPPIALFLKIFLLINNSEDILKKGNAPQYLYAFYISSVFFFFRCINAAVRGLRRRDLKVQLNTQNRETIHKTSTVILINCAIQLCLENGILGMEALLFTQQQQQQKANSICNSKVPWSP